MGAESRHLADLRESLEAVRARPEDGAALHRAVEVLLETAIVHHEGAEPHIGVETTPDFMEAGEPIQAPPAEESIR